MTRLALLYECNAVVFTFLFQVVQSMKMGHECDDEVIAPSIVKYVDRVSKHYGMSLTRKEITAANISSSLRAVYTAVWMERFFRLTGDPMPNTDGEVHLEKQEMMSIWREYKEDFEYRNRQPLSYKSFVRIWRDCFAHVKIRAYKQVSGELKT